MALLGGAFTVDSAQGMLMVVLFMMAGFISILVHEMGHALMIRKYGLQTQVTLAAFGGYASYQAGILSRKQSFLVTAAGPGLQIIFGLLVLVLAGIVAPPSIPIAYFIKVLCWISLAWAFLNCLPIYPLDGGQMLAAVLGPRRGRAVHLTGVVVAGILAVLGFASNQWFIAVFMALFAWQNYQMMQRSP